MPNPLRTTFTIEACNGCPFFERSVVSFLADHFMKRDTQSGVCRFYGVGLAFPEGRRVVSDSSKIPDDCPIKGGQAIVEVKR